jgi:folate-dependent phosphoribosylglycinamide formyltransferase PurN
VIQSEKEPPIRVVMFGSGPKLTPDAGEFLCRLEDHPDITLLGAFCQAEAQTAFAVFQDLWKRRGILAIPLLLASNVNILIRLISHPQSELDKRRKLRSLADRLHFVKDIHSEGVLKQVGLLNPDLGLIYGSPILKPLLFEIPKYGTLGIHHGQVPEYRGNKTTFWAMYNDEKVAGVTIQKINAGLDTGQIVNEDEVIIGGRSLGAVWRELEKVGLNLYIHSIIQVKDGTATYHAQTGKKGKLYRNPKLKDLFHFWAKQIQRRVNKP